MKAYLRAITTALAAGIAFPAVAVTPSTPPFHDGFETYTVGGALATEGAGNGWAASSATVAIQTNTVKSGAKAVTTPANTAVTNVVNGTGLTNLWIEYQFNAASHMAPDTAPTVNPGAVLTLYIGTNGFVSVYNPNVADYVVCSNDAWGTTVTNLIGSNAWVRLSTHYDYAAHRAAVFVDDRCLVAGLPFISNRNELARYELENGGGGPAYLDDFLITNAVPAGLTADRDRDGMADAQEIQSYGNLTTRYPPIITVTATNLSGVGAGGTFNTLAGFSVDYNAATTFVLTANAGYYVAGALTNGTSVGAALSGRNTGSGQFTCSGIVADTAVTLQFARKPQIGAADNTVGGPGGAGGSIGLSATEVYPGGSVDVTASAYATFTVTDIRTNGVSVGAFSGKLTRNASFRLGSVAADVTVTVQFTYTAGAIVAQGLDYFDGFENYTSGDRLDQLGYFGWGASSTGTVVQTNTVCNGLKAASVTADSTLSNRITSASGIKVWTDVHWKETAHVEALTAPGADTNASIIMYLNTNGYAVVYDIGHSSWITCSNDAWGHPVTGAATGTWTRFTLHQDYGTHKAALFLDNHLLREQLDFNPSRTSYSQYRIDSGTAGAALLDDVRIQTVLPPGLTGNFDGDDAPDALEIHLYGTTTNGIFNGGTRFMFR